jgi:hypothetical protein
MKKMVATTQVHKPVAKPALAKKEKDTDGLFGFMAGKGEIIGDILAPAFSPEEWGDLYTPSRPRRPRR